MPADLHSILRIEVPLIVQVASRKMPVEDVLKLSPGAIIELPKLADEELEIMVANKQIGLGNAVKVGENFGVRVTYVGDAAAHRRVGHRAGRGGHRGVRRSAEPREHRRAASPRAVAAAAGGHALPSPPRLSTHRAFLSRSRRRLTDSGECPEAA